MKPHFVMMSAHRWLVSVGAHTSHNLSIHRVAVPGKADHFRVDDSDALHASLADAAGAAAEKLGYHPS